MSEDILDYDLEPFTVEALKAWADGNDPSRGEDYTFNLTEIWVDRIAMLDEYTKGLVIIDLLTLCDALKQTISAMQINQIEEGMK